MRPDTWHAAFGLGSGLGGGIGGPGLNSEGFAGFLEVVASRGAHRVSLRYAGVAGPFGGSGAWDLALLYGLGRRTSGSPRVSASIGVSFASVEDEGAAVGLPLSLRVLFRLGKSVSMGVHGFADLNRRNGFAGGALAFYFGPAP